MLVLSIRGIVLLTAKGSLTVMVLSSDERRVGFAATQDIKIIRFDVLESLLTDALRGVQGSPQELPRLFAANADGSKQSLAMMKASYQHALSVLHHSKLNPESLFNALVDPNVLEMLIEFHA